MEGVMATCTATGGALLLRAALLVTTGLILSIGSPAWAGVGVTSAAGGQTQTATRAGSRVITDAGGVPGAPTLLKPGSLSAALSNLEGAKSNSNNGPDQSAEKSGFSNKNSGQPAIAPTFNQNLPPNTNN